MSKSLSLMEARELGVRRQSQLMALSFLPTAALLFRRM